MAADATTAVAVAMAAPMAAPKVAIQVGNSPPAVSSGPPSSTLGPGPTQEAVAVHRLVSLRHHHHNKH